MKRHLDHVLFFLVLAGMPPSIGLAWAGLAAAPALPGSEQGMAKPPGPPKTTVARTGGLFLKIAGIGGTCAAAGHEDEIELLSFGLGVLTPRDSASQMATGKRQYEPFLVSKRIDQASPLLMQANVVNRILDTVELNCYRPAGGCYYRIRLTRAAIVSIKQSADRESGGLPGEEVGFTFQKIEWIWTEGNITASDERGQRN